MSYEYLSQILKHVLFIVAMFDQRSNITEMNLLET